MLAHVNQLTGFADSLEGGFNHIFGGTNKGDYSAVGGLTRVNIQQFYIFCVLYFRNNLTDDFWIAPLAEVGHAFHNTLFYSHIFKV